MPDEETVDLDEVCVAAISRLNSSVTDIAKLLKEARFDLHCISDVARLVLSVPDNLQTDSFNVFYHHLQKPVDRCQNTSGERVPRSFVFKMYSIFGLRNLGCSYFNRGSEHKQRFHQMLATSSEVHEGILRRTSLSTLRSLGYRSFPVGSICISGGSEERRRNSSCSRHLERARGARRHRHLLQFSPVNMYTKGSQVREMDRLLIGQLRQ